MIKVQGKLPKKLNVAFSGGVDSVAITDFLARKHDIKLIFVHHGTANSESAYNNVVKHLLYDCDVHYITDETPQGVSSEAWWHEKRYEIFNSYDDPVVTGHHLDDMVETWIWSSLNGNPQIMKYRSGNVIRPFRLNRKEEFYDLAKKNFLSWSEDKSNLDMTYTRNYIRHSLMPHALKVNPGLYKVIRKKVMKDVED